MSTRSRRSRKALRATLATLVGFAGAPGAEVRRSKPVAVSEEARLAVAAQLQDVMATGTPDWQKLKRLTTAINKLVIAASLPPISTVARIDAR